MQEVIDEVIAILDKARNCICNYGGYDAVMIDKKDISQALAKLRSIKAPEPTEFTRNIRDTLEVMDSHGKFHRKIMEKACDIIEQQSALETIHCDQIESQAEQIEELQAEKTELKQSCTAHQEYARQRLDRIHDLEAENTKLILQIENTLKSSIKMLDRLKFVKL